MPEFYLVYYLIWSLQFPYGLYSINICNERLDNKKTVNFVLDMLNLRFLQDIQMEIPVKSESQA